MPADAREAVPTLECDAKMHTLRGPLLADVLRVAGIQDAADTPLVLRALDRDAVPLTLDEVRYLGLIVGAHLDGAPMLHGWPGPLWVVLDAGRIPELATKPLPKRFAQCLGGLCHVAVDV